MALTPLNTRIFEVKRIYSVQAENLTCAKESISTIHLSKTKIN